MVDIDVLTKHKVTQDRLKAIFTAEDGPDKVIADKIRKRIRDRIQNGISYNINNYRHWYACDVAWDVPFRQSTYSLVRGMMDKRLSSEDISKALEGVDLSDMVLYYDKSGKQLSGRINQSDVAETKVHAPTFFHIFLPLAKAYTTIRAAAIVNSYRQVPLFDYEASKSTPQNRLKSEIITDRVELMNSQYGYFDIVKQAVMHMLHYSVAVLFPAEQWHEVRQRLNVPDDADPTKTTEKEVVVKEGVRFNVPHPSRVFLDTAYRPSTINSDTGVMYGGYWSIVRASEVASNPDIYWNAQRITTGVTDWITQSPAFFNTVYSSCALRFADKTSTDRGDRETRTTWYTMADTDKALTLIQYFEKLNPKEHGLGDYDYDVWFRFVIAGDDTVTYAAPLPYCPMVYFGYDALETRAQNSSMTLEILPFQDHISNLFSQYILTVKQNLTNLTLFDTNQIDKVTIDQIKGLGHQAYSQRNFLPMDMRTNRMGQNNIAEAFQTFTFPIQPTGDLINGVNELLRVLERMLVLSPQELAQTASHELTAEEVRNMNEAKSTRYEFTAGAVDRGIYALKVLLYQGLMSYAEPDLYARLATPVSEQDLTKLGFTVEHSDAQSKLVKGKKSAVFIESFASTRDGDLRTNSPQVAQAMTQLLQSITGNQALLMEVGVPQAITLVNAIASTLGLPRDFRFTPTGANAEQQAQQLQQQVEQLSTKIEQSAVADVASQLKPIFEKQKEKFDAIEQQLQQLAALITQAGSPPPQNVPPIQNAPVPGPIAPVTPMAGPPGGPPVPPNPGVPIPAGQP